MIVKLLRSWPGIVALLALVGTCGLLTARPAAAEDGQTLDWGASIAGVDLRAWTPGARSSWVERMSALSSSPFGTPAPHR